MSKTTINLLDYNYEFNDETFNGEVDCELQSTEPIKPNILVTKQGFPSSVGIGTIITYTVTIIVASGDDYFTKPFNATDTLDETTEFIDGTLKLNGEVMTSQCLTNIEFELHPDTTYILEYQCLKIKY